MVLITFGSKSRQLTSDRKTPDQYDLIYWDNISCRIYDYTDAHERLVETQVGFWYHILLFQPKLSKKADYMFSELFTACLIDPLTYAESMARNYQGFIGKMSNKSQEFFDSALASIQTKGNSNEYIRTLSKS